MFLHYFIAWSLNNIQKRRTFHREKKSSKVDDFRGMDKNVEKVRGVREVSRNYSGKLRQTGDYLSLKTLSRFVRSLLLVGIFKIYDEKKRVLKQKLGTK